MLSLKKILIILILKCLEQSKCSVCKNKKSILVKEQEAKGLLSELGIKTPFTKIPLLNVLF